MGLPATSGQCECGVPVRTFPYHTDLVYNLLFESVRIISGSWDTSILSWGLANKSLEHSYVRHR
ncbi:Mitochondrial division protein 1 [Taenia solium]|eukprot:TsM_000428400 transcript=TsM_000428400 gene=TsM_000428400